MTEPGRAFANLLFDIFLRQWREEAWRVKRVPGFCQNQGRVCEDTNTVYLYPDQIAADGDEEAKVMLEEMVHIGTDLDNFPPVEHRYVCRLTRLMWDHLDGRRKGILQALMTMGE